MSGLINSAGSKSGVIGTTELDYEEGTWTPAIYGNGNGSDPNSYSVQDGFYTKIGREVTCRFYILFSAIGTNSGGYMLLRNFPFLSPSDWWGGISSTIFFQNNSVNSVNMGLQLDNGSNQAYMFYTASAAGSVSYFPVSGGLGTYSKLAGTFTYFTA